MDLYLSGFISTSVRDISTSRNLTLASGDAIAGWKKIGGYYFNPEALASIIFP